MTWEALRQPDSYHVSDSANQEAIWELCDQPEGTSDEGIKLKQLGWLFRNKDMSKYFTNEFSEIQACTWK